jgi:FkbM family methyltransferase
MQILTLRELLRKLPAPILYRIIAMKMFIFGEPECKLLKKVVPDNKIALDIGANRGAYTYWLSKLTYKVIAFEPIPYLATFIHNVAASNVEVYNCGLSDSKSRTILFMPLRNGYPVEGESTINPMKKPHYTFEIDLIRLDDLNLNNVGFMKIDVEGHELLVLNGAKNMIKNNLPIILIEIEQRHIDFPIENVFSYLESFGYCGYFYFSKRLQPLSKLSIYNYQKNQCYKLQKKRIKTINNFFFFHKNQMNSDIRKLILKQG